MCVFVGRGKGGIMCVYVGMGKGGIMWFMWEGVKKGVCCLCGKG